MFFLVVYCLNDFSVLFIEFYLLNYFQVRNCTKIPKKITEEIIGLIVNSLLSKENLVNFWNAGGTLHLGEIPKTVLNADLLKELKSECGGLQTLLRNHNHIFIVNKGLS